MRTTNGSDVIRARDRRRVDALVRQQAALTAKTRTLVVELRDKGATVIELATAFDVSRQTIYRWLREAERQQPEQ